MSPAPYRCSNMRDRTGDNNNPAGTSDRQSTSTQCRRFRGFRRFRRFRRFRGCRRFRRFRG